MQQYNNKQTKKEKKHLCLERRSRYQDMSVSVWGMNILHYPWKGTANHRLGASPHTGPRTASHCASQAFLNLRNEK